MGWIWIDSAQWQWLLDTVENVRRDVAAIRSQQGHSRTREVTTMATLQEVIEEVRAQRSKIDGIDALFDGLRQQLLDALAQIGTVTPEMQAEIDTLFAEAKQNSDKIDQAIAENTPTPPEPAPPG